VRAVALGGNVAVESGQAFGAGAPAAVYVIWVVETAYRRMATEGAAGPTATITVPAIVREPPVGLVMSVPYAVCEHQSTSPPTIGFVHVDDVR
jgi:hypothetical protein